MFCLRAPLKPNGAKYDRNISKTGFIKALCPCYGFTVAENVIMLLVYLQMLVSKNGFIVKSK